MFHKYEIDYASQYQKMIPQKKQLLRYEHELGTMTLMTNGSVKRERTLLYVCFFMLMLKSTDRYDSKLLVNTKSRTIRNTSAVFVKPVLLSKNGSSNTGQTR